MAKLSQDDIVVENPKDNNGRYENKACKKRIPSKDQEQLIWYDWSQIRNWFCVTVKQSKNQSHQNQTGWIHRLLVRKTIGSD
ncbi:hypothetical protein BGP_6049 [Beggiatoa sp. PS]|nr:hypothetical protein BGP_6049 [Beggiatoa sp. PS]